MKNEKEIVYNLNKTKIYKNIGLHALGIILILSVCYMIVISNDIEKLKIEGTLLMFFGISSIMFIPFLMGQIIGIIFEIKNFFHQRGILRISEYEIQYSPYYIEKIIIKKNNINRIYISKNNYIAVQLKEGIDIKTSRWSNIFRKSQLSHCIYICIDELNCPIEKIALDLKKILGVNIDIS